MLYDLHIHSALSPCADDDMTPATIAGMAKLAGAEVIAIADHNCALNLPAAKIACDEYKIKLLPAIEVNTAEEIHLLCYFKTVEDALKMSDKLYEGLMDFKYDEEIWGRQLVLDENDEIIKTLPKLLTSASEMDIYTAKEFCESLGGIAVPAHVDKDSYSLLSVLGFCPEDLDFCAFEMKNIENYPQLCDKQFLPLGREILHSSDAHCIEKIAENMHSTVNNSIIERLL